MEVVTGEAAPTGKPLKGCTHPPVTVNDPTEEPTALQVRHGEQAKVEAPHSGFPSWMKVLHPPWLATAMEQVPPAFGESKQKHCSWSVGGRRAWHQRMEEHLQAAELDPMSPPKSPKLVQEITPPPGFMGVVACLQKDPSPMATIEAPMKPMQPEIMVEPAVATMCTSHIIQDETTGVTYMDMVTTSVGRVALSSSHLVACPLDPP